MARTPTGGRRGNTHSSPPSRVGNPLGEPPEGMGEIAVMMWKHIQSLEWVSESDRFAVMEACRLYEIKETIRLKFELGVVPMTITIPNQGARLHPEVALMKDLQAQLSALLRDLGLSPQGRRGLEIQEQKPKTELEEYSERRNRRFQEREKDK